MQKELKHLDMARESAKEMLIDVDRPLLLFKASWQTVRHEDLLGLLAICSQLLDYMAAGHIMGDTQRFCSARDALLGHAVVFLERFQPINEILIVELSLALTAKRQLIAKTLSTAILSRDIKGTLTLDKFQALSLASLVSKDYPGAPEYCGGFNRSM
ncbi:hypothetical protein [Pseudomonas sp.]|uniref:hypothetical protein n=1 Tax=Pseudomonas sp. TaxID=306 RepID=UPI00289DA49F|nr:hypothetical protein [Pseudomonas sp.]